MEANNKVAMETLQDNLSLSEEEKLRRVKEAKGGTWYDGWRPYCMRATSEEEWTNIHTDSDALNAAIL